MEKFDEQKIEAVLDKTEENVQYINSIAASVVTSYSESLDTVMQNIYTDIITAKDTQGVATNVIEQYYLELANILYFMYSKVESLGLYDDISKTSAKEVYNDAYMNSQLVFDNKKPTVAESTAVAEKSALYESTVNNMYSRSYKIFKSKIDAGYEMCRCLSKIISRRMQDEAMTSKDTDTGTQLLLEGKLGK